MPVVDTDIIIYGAANMVEDDTSTVGGAIDKTVKILDTDLAADDTFDVVSDDAGDTGTHTVRITGRLPNGVIATEDYSLTGTSLQSGSTTFERILKVVVTVGGSHDGIITVTENSGGLTVATLEGTTDAPGGTAILENRRPFLNTEAEASGGSDVTYYEKVFIANTNLTLALTNAKVEMTDDGSGDNVDFDLENARNDTGTEPNRLTEPDAADVQGAPDWDDTQKDVPGGDLEDRGTGTADHIGVWMRLLLPDGEPPANTSVTFNVVGSST